MHDERKAKILEILDLCLTETLPFSLFFILFPPGFVNVAAAFHGPNNKKRRSYSAGHNQSTAGRGILAQLEETVS